jgi:hypothetical protein
MTYYDIHHSTFDGHGKLFYQASQLCICTVHHTVVKNAEIKFALRQNGEN